MNDQSSNQTHSDEIITPPNSNYQTSQNLVDKTHRKFNLTLVLTLIIALISAGYFAFQYFHLRSINNQSLPNSNSLTNNAPTISEPQLNQSNSVNPEPITLKPQILFIKDPDRNSYKDLQAWLIDPDGQNPHQLDLPVFRSAFKYPFSHTVFLIQEATPDTLTTINLISKETKSYPLIKHPDPDVTENITINAMSNIFPDDTAIIYRVWFSNTCPESQTVPSDPNFVGGYEPCVPDPDPNVPAGDYLLNLKTQKSTFLGDSIQVSRWDTDNKKVYFMGPYKDTGLFSLDLNSNQIKLIDKANTFGYAAYPFFQSSQLIKIEGTTGDNNEANSMSRLSLINTKTNTTEVIDSGKWAEIQPFVSVSPDEMSFLYERTYWVNGFGIYNLYLYDFKTKRTKLVTSQSNSESYSIHGVWIDSQTFVTSVDTIEKEDYYDGNNYLVSINTQTGQVKRITPNNDVYRFATQ